MSDQLRSPHAYRKDLSGDGGSLLATLRRLWPYIWPSDRADLKHHVLMSLGTLLLSKFATISVPFAFKWATDALERRRYRAGRDEFVADMGHRGAGR